MARVLLTGFCAVPGPRRAGVQLRHVIRSLTPLHTVDLLVSREGEQAYVERQGSVRVLRVPTHEADLKSAVQAFQRALKRQLDGADYDFVHCRDSWSGIPVLEARARMGYAVVYDLTRSPLGETTFDTDLDAQYGRDEEACLLAADLILAPTAAAVKSLQARGRPDRVILSPPGVDVDRFDWDDVTSAGPPRILYCGSIDPGRGVRVLVRAMAAIVREVDAKLVLAGPITTAVPKFEQALRDGIRELGLTDKVDILGPVDHDQLPALLATATVCVVPAAADLTPNPTVVYPTKLLEYMACRCAIVAPRRDTVMHVVDNNREALLFEPGDPIDLARKVLRLLDEPALRRNLAHNAYERVRRDFTASAARRAIRNAYAVLTERYADQIDDAEDEAPKVVILADDDFEATVFEEAPGVSPDNTAENKIGNLADALASLDDHTGSTSSESIAAPPAPSDETMERAPVPPRSAKRAGDKDGWVVTNLGRVLDDDDDDDAIEVESGEIQPADDHTDGHDGGDGTPIEGVVAAAPPLGSLGESTFVAGEIDVPTPPPERAAAAAVEIDLDQLVSPPGSLLGTPEPDPDTGSRTPPLERR